MQNLPRHILVDAAYNRIAEVLLVLKGIGYSEDVLADAIVRAAREAGIERIK